MALNRKHNSPIYIFVYLLVGKYLFSYFYLTITVLCLP